MASRVESKVGVSLDLKRLKQYHEWVLGEQRSVEFQDAANPGLLDDDWKSAAAVINQLLDGHTAERGIHGPFDRRQRFEDSQCGH